jgi:drug/metabolite transporter (DMT)-like permease
LQASISSTAQLLTLARYIFAFSLSAVQYWQECSKARSSSHNYKLSWQTKNLLLLMGLCDLASYSIFNLGFAACGSAVAAVVLAASGQIFTAAIAVLCLHKRLSWKHMAAVGVVTAGLVLRSLDDLLLVPGATAADSKGNQRSKPTSDAIVTPVLINPEQLFGISCVVLSALLFSILGCLYEVLMNRGTERVSQPQVMRARGKTAWSFTGFDACSMEQPPNMLLPCTQGAVNFRCIDMTICVAGRSQLIFQQAQCSMAHPATPGTS